MTDSLNAAETRAMLLYVAAAMQAEKDVLTQADRAIGDGDHGVGMARGFAAAQKALEAGAGDSIAGACKAVGTALLSATGGAAGAIFGTFFRAGAEGLAAADNFDAAALATFLNEGLAAVMQRGKAAPGDKTVVDALAPAAAAAAATRDSCLEAALVAASDAAAAGVAATRGMVARVGKAKTLGERSLGHPDPGALSLSLILRHMLHYVQQLDRGR